MFNILERLKCEEMQRGGGEMVSNIFRGVNSLIKEYSKKRSFHDDDDDDAWLYVLVCSSQCINGHYFLMLNYYYTDNMSKCFYSKHFNVL